jgi:Fic family protein
MKVPATPPSSDALLKRVVGIPRFVQQFVRNFEPTPQGKYHHWDTLRRLTPPNDLSHEEWWLVVKMARAALLRPLPLTDERGRAFWFAIPDIALPLIHHIDRQASGRIALPEPVTNPATQSFYLVNSLIEEAITSSQLEGASTTRQVAEQMLRTGRRPRDTSETMILNNYMAMDQVAHRSDAQSPLTIDRVLELHRILTTGTLEKPDAAGRFRRPDERVFVGDGEGTILHTPPPAAELRERVQRMCDFANSANEKPFIHPVVRSILLHFWLAYDHPFVDGNGRTARALFYWSMIKHDYWLTKFLSISSILRKGHAKYHRSFLYTETDDNDTTYFVMAQLEVIRQAVDQLSAYLLEKVNEIRSTEELMRKSSELNHRQLALLTHALKRPNTDYTIEAHSTSHRVAYQTARTDLLALAAKGLLKKRKVGKAFYFTVPSDLSARLKR